MSISRVTLWYVIEFYFNLFVVNQSQKTLNDIGVCHNLIKVIIDFINSTNYQVVVCETLKRNHQVESILIDFLKGLQLIKLLVGTTYHNIFYL